MTGAHCAQRRPTARLLQAAQRGHGARGVRPGHRRLRLPRPQLRPADRAQRWVID